MTHLGACRALRRAAPQGCNPLGVALLAWLPETPLRLLIGAVENSVSGSAFRPGDVLATRKGLRVEIGNTDAEGRLVLCDLLAEGDRERPALMIDCATLTGSVVVALGYQAAAVLGNDQELVGELIAAGKLDADSRRVVATNRLVLVVPAGSKPVQSGTTSTSAAREAARPAPLSRPGRFDGSRATTRVPATGITRASTRGSSSPLGRLATNSTGGPGACGKCSTPSTCRRG